MFNPELQIGTGFAVRSKEQITTSYVAGTAFSMDYHNAIGIVYDYAKGTETSTELKFEVSNDGGTIYSQQVAESTSAGTITTSLAERTFSATGIYSILVQPVRAKLVKVSVKATYGTASTGSVTITAYPLWV